MFRWIILTLFLILLALMVLAGFVVQTFGWAGFFGMLATAAVFGYVLAKFLPRFLFAMLLKPLKRVGQVLANSTVRVNAFVAADPPNQFDTYDDSDDDEEMRKLGQAPKLNWFSLDVTIVPQNSLTDEPESLTEKKWQPDSLMLASSEQSQSSMPVFMAPLTNMTGSGVCLIAEKVVWDGFDFVSHDGSELWGIQRLRLHVGVPQSVRRIAFVYQMFTRFGDIPVPHDKSLRY